MFLYYRKNGEVVMKSEEKMDTPFLVLEVNPDEDKVKENWKMKVNDGQVEYEKPQYIKDKEKPSAEELKEKVEKAKTINEMKDIIKLLIQ